MVESAAWQRQSGYLLAAGLVVALLLPTAGASAGVAAVDTQPGTHARIENVRIGAGKTGLEVRGTVRLLAAPLPHSDVGRIVLEAVVQGRTIARSEAVVYRVVTANRRLRLFGFRAVLPADTSAETQLRIHRLPPAD
ncbi:MAG: hypothetical protein P8124_06760 [Gammaproteobacteria bacterium]